jgi:ABC-type bacteriocin/lantibiotic exporter with double-glycine peptidase domain
MVIWRRRAAITVESLIVLKGVPPAAALGAESIESVAELLRAQRPVILLLQERRHRYHYVVVVGITDTRIVVHDPARGPSRLMSFAQFMSGWESAGFGALLVLPGPSRTGSHQIER